MLRRLQRHPFVWLVLFWLLIVFFALKRGAFAGADLDLILELRLPRVILASAIGMGLAVAGTALQALFANPLCEPYTLGISSGAALGAVVGVSLGFRTAILGLAPTAFCGALGVGATLLLISLRRNVTNLGLLLAGVMLGFFCSSLVALWMALADPSGIQGAIFWLMGDLSRAETRGAMAILGVVLFLSSAIWSRWRELDAFLMGEEDALSIGVDVVRARRRLLLLTCVLVGVCVSSAGIIGFVGLVVPHFARRCVGSLHLKLIPFCALVGAVALTAADLGARTLHSPYELPAGVVTAIIGVPVFLLTSFWSRREDA